MKEETQVQSCYNNLGANARYMHQYISKNNGRDGNSIKWTWNFIASS